MAMNNGPFLEEWPRTMALFPGNGHGKWPISTNGHEEWPWKMAYFAVREVFAMVLAGLTGRILPSTAVVSSLKSDHEPWPVALAQRRTTCYLHPLGGLWPRLPFTPRRLVVGLNGLSSDSIQWPVTTRSGHTC